MRAVRVVILVLGVVLLVLAIGKLNVREIVQPGLCGSIIQGSSWDDGGARTQACNRLRHNDEIATTALFILAFASFGLVVGHTLYSRTSKARRQ